MLLTKTQLITMLNLQDRMNSAVNPNWRTAGNSWTLAMLVETGEAIDHSGWPWWKKLPVNMPQLQLELVDVWHFLLSYFLEHSEVGNTEQVEAVADVIFARIEESRNYEEAVKFNETFYELEDMSLIDTMRLMAGMAAVNMVSIRVFDACIQKAELEWVQLYKAYVGKNILNIHRQKNGYKTGGYLKDWTAVRLDSSTALTEALEDNDHLHDILLGLDEKSEKFAGLLELEITSRYLLVKEAAVATKAE